MDLFVAILKQLLVETLYPATIAELNHAIYTNEKGIMLKMNGFNQKLPVRILIIRLWICIQIHIFMNTIKKVGPR